MWKLKHDVLGTIEIAAMIKISVGSSSGIVNYTNTCPISIYWSFCHWSNAFKCSSYTQTMKQGIIPSGYSFPHLGYSFSLSSLLSSVSNELIVMMIERRSASNWKQNNIVWLGWILEYLVFSELVRIEQNDKRGSKGKYQPRWFVFHSA